MACEYDHSMCCGLLASASDSASASVREIYRRPARRRYHRHVGRRRLLHQHVSCPNNFMGSDGLTTTSADELSAWSWRRTRSDLPPMGAAPYKTDRPRVSVRPARAGPPPATRRTASRHCRTTTIVHHPCCIYEPKLCPVMKGSHHRQRMRPGDVDSETLRETEELRARIESYLYQQPRRMQQKVPCQPEATAQVPGTMPQHQSKQMTPGQQSDPRAHKCKLCGNAQHFTEPTTQYAQDYVRQPAAGQPFARAAMLTPEVSSETADRMLDELSRRSVGPRPTHSPQRANMGDVTGQQRNLASAATTNIYPASLTVGLRKGNAGMTNNFKMEDIASSPPLADINHGHITIQNMTHPRRTATGPVKQEYYSQHLSHVLEHRNKMRPQTPIKTGPPMTQIDVGTSYTMQSFASARAASTKNPDNETTQRYAPNCVYSYEGAAKQPENETMNYQQTTRRAASEGAKPSVDMMFPPSPPKSVFTFGGQDQDDSRDKVGRIDTDLRITPQPVQDSARFTAGTYETDVSELQQTGIRTAATETSSSNGDYQTDNQTVADSVPERSLHHMNGVKEVLKNWQSSASDPAQVNGLHSRTDMFSSPAPSTYRASAVGDANHVPISQGASSQALPSARKSVISPTTHRGDGNHQESDIRKSGNKRHDSINVAECDDSATYSRPNCDESLSKTDDCGSCSNCSNAEQGDKQQEAMRNVSRGGTPTVERGCKSTPNAEDKATVSSRATSGSSSTIASTKTARRRHKDRGDGDAKVVASESNDNSLLAVDRQLLELGQRRKIVEYMDKALALILSFPSTDLHESGSQPKLQSADQFLGRSKSLMSDNSDLEPQRACSSVEFSSELWGHVDTTIKDSLASISQIRASKAAGVSSGEDRNNRKLLKKLQRDLTKNILTNLKRLEDIESLLHTNNGGGPSNPPSK